MLLNQKVTPTMLAGEQNWLQDLCPLEYAAPDVDVYEIGDGRSVGNIMCAIWVAYEVARGL